MDPLKEGVDYLNRFTLNLALIAVAVVAILAFYRFFIKDKWF